MKEPIFFLRTKLLAPRAVSGLLDRPRLTEKLQANLNAPITMVAADAGCGKTTLIADFIRRQTRPTVWYQLDHTDADPVVFLSYVARGIQDIYPGFGEAIFPYLAEANEEVTRFPERAADLLINELLQTVEQPLILVLDDYHHIGRNTIVHKLVDRLLQYSSDLLHLIITTRDYPPLAIMRRRSQSAALVITRDDLLFNDAEVKGLFTQALNIELQEKEVEEYRNRTNGWITALQLVRQVAEQEIHAAAGQQRIDLHDILRRSEKDIFDYFAEEVLSREDEETRKLLFYLSLLESLPLDLCSRLFPEMRCSAALPELVQKNVFLTIAGDDGVVEEYRFHPLFRDFLLRRLRSEIGHAGVAAERNRIAEDFIKHKQWELALPHLLEAENYDRAAELIAEHGNDWIEAGAFTSLGQFAEKVPSDVLERFPRAVLHRAEIARLQGEAETSSKLLHRAVKLLHQQKDTVGEAEALHSLASLTRRRGRASEALALLEKAEKLVPNDSETYLKCSNTRGLCLIAEGKWTAAEQQFRLALDLAERLSNDHYIRLVTHNLALPPGFRGDFGEALRWLGRIFPDDLSDKQLPQDSIGHLNVARLHLYRGEFDATEKHLSRALELCQLYNLKSLRGEIFEAYANFYREKGDFAHAGEYYERSLKAYDDAKVDLAAREVDEERAKFYLLTGKITKARVLVENLIASREKAKNPTGSYTARVWLARIKLIEGKTDGLINEITELLVFFRSQNHYYDDAVASLLLAETYFTLRKAKEMIDPLKRVLDLSARFDYDYWLRGEIRRLPNLFGHEDIIDYLPVDLRNELKADELNPASVAATATEVIPPVTDLTIRLLGPVEIKRDIAKPFAADAWTTRRARDIFCCIASSRHRRVQKDVLIEEFWADEDLAAIEKNFHPTISHIRKALNSRQTLKQNFLVFRDGAYQLNPELSYSIDCEEFEQALVHAEKAKREKNAGLLRTSLETAHDLYRGEFMSGVYEDWAEQRRVYYREQFSRVLGALAKNSFAEKRWSKALKYSNQILADDPFREDMHRLVMKVFAAQSKPAAIRDQFEGLKNLLKKELGVEPAAETRRVFQELTEANS